MKILLELPIKVGKTYYTRKGHKIKIYATNAGGRFPIHGAVKQDEERSIIEKWTRAGESGIVNEIPYNFSITHQEWEPEDKELVWAWSDCKRFERCLRFYDAKNNCTFNGAAGNRDGFIFQHYAPYEDEWPNWAKEAYKMLED